MEPAMKISTNLGRALALIAGLAMAATVGAQSAPPAATTTAPAKAASPAKVAKQEKKAKKAKKTSAGEYKLVVEPRAMELLKAVSTKLAAAKSMSFTATAGYEYPSRLGPPILYTVRYDVTMQRPDRLRVVIPGDGPTSEFYYDGKSMVVYAPVENLAATADAPATIDAMLQAAFRNSAIFFPFEDLVAADPYAAMTNGAILAFYVGPSGVVGGVRTDMVAWANDDVFLQIWIGADDKLPRRVRAMFRTDPLGSRHQVDFTDWKLDPAVAPDTFASAKAQAAGRMAFAAPSAPPKSVKPLTAGKSTPAAPAKAK
jgi:hypothetical protein